ncbi:hypothetical protein ACLF4E_001888 [Cronobacter malonaticus]|nr:hypothetical protein [Cronobacter malonaticus]ELZ9928651.1 hypothetical protein [Cronobacter malonaticus]MDT3538193.1 hypothetical protein [Cronobacter malonaticus]
MKPHAFFFAFFFTFP